ncbi:MAG: nuclear transport factor 2 family protein [Acidobacteriota bacterium]|nr:MAG: nuclear transport factor 2 family protein [Acidobacteriota bacterium]
MRSWTMVGLLLLVVAALPACRGVDVPTADLEQLDQELDQFKQQIINEDIDGLMANYVQTPNPDGFYTASNREGWDEIKQAWEDFFAKNNIESLEFSEVHNKGSGRLAASWGLWSMVYAASEGGPPTRAEGRFTRIYGMRESEWVVLHEHSSMPIPEPPPEPLAEEAAD